MRKVWRSVWTGSVLESPWRAGALTLQTGAEMGIKRFPRPNLIFFCVCVSVCVPRPHCDFQTLTLSNTPTPLQFDFLRNRGGPLETRFLNSFTHITGRVSGSVFWTFREEHCLSNSLVFFYINSHRLYSADTNLILHIAHHEKYPFGI